MAAQPWTRYKLQRKLFAIGEDFWIENDRGEAVFKVDGKALSLRHTFLTRLGESGCDAWTLARIAGHSSITISSRYVHPSEDAVLSAMSRLGGHKTGHNVEPEDCEPASKVLLSA